MSAVVPPAITAHLRRARLGAFGIFFIVGFITAVWLVNIPAVQKATDISHAVLGVLILGLGLGSLVAMQFIGFLIDRLGSRFTTLLAVALMIVAVNLPGFATNAVTLGIALFILGIGLGGADVAMNHQAVIVERQYPRPIMSTFHAFYSFGGAAGAGLGALAQAVNLDLHWALAGAAIIGLVVVALCGSSLLSRSEERAFEAQSVAADESANGTLAPADARRKIVALAILAFLLMLSEGVANDWSALHAVEHLDQPEAAASLAYGAFAVAMTIGRLLADRVSHAVGALNVVRYGSAISAVGLLVVVLSMSFPLTVAGWAIFGIGMSGIIPQIFTAAGNIDKARSGVILSRVVGAGYFGILAGPAVIGILGGSIGLTMAFILPIAFCALGVLLAPNVAVRRAR